MDPVVDMMVLIADMALLVGMVRSLRPPGSRSTPLLSSSIRFRYPVPCSGSHMLLFGHHSTMQAEARPLVHCQGRLENTAVGRDNLPEEGWSALEDGLVGKRLRHQEHLQYRFVSINWEARRQVGLALRCRPIAALYIQVATSVHSSKVTQAQPISAAAVLVPRQS